MGSQPACAVPERVVQCVRKALSGVVAVVKVSVS